MCLHGQCLRINPLNAACIQFCLLLVQIVNVVVCIKSSYTCLFSLIVKSTFHYSMKTSIVCLYIEHITITSWVYCMQAVFRDCSTVAALIMRRLADDLIRCIGVLLAISDVRCSSTKPVNDLRYTYLIYLYLCLRPQWQNKAELI